MFTTFPYLYVIFCCSKQSPVDFTLILGPKSFNVELRILSEVEIALKLSLDNPLDFHFETFKILCNRKCFETSINQL